MTKKEALESLHRILILAYFKDTGEPKGDVKETRIYDDRVELELENGQVVEYVARVSNKIN